MGPCQVGCRVFMLPCTPILTMERLVGGVHNEHAMSFSHALLPVYQVSLLRVHCSRKKKREQRNQGGPGVTLHTKVWKCPVRIFFTTTNRGDPRESQDLVTNLFLACLLVLSLRQQRGVTLSLPANHSSTPPGRRSSSPSSVSRWNKHGCHSAAEHVFHTRKASIKPPSECPSWNCFWFHDILHCTAENLDAGV